MPIAILLGLAIIAIIPAAKTTISLDVYFIKNFIWYLSYTIR